LSLPDPGFSFEESLAGFDLVGTRTALAADPRFGACAPEVARVARVAADALVAGARLTATDVQVALADPEEAWRVLMAPDPLALYAPFLPARAADVNPLLQMIFGLAEGL